MTQVKTTTNALKHTITTSDREGNDLVINIRLNDECRNGHQDFAITATGYKKGERSERAFLYGGCCYKEILAVRPDLAIFVTLDLCDYLGTPMYPCANGYFHMKDERYDRPMAKGEFCDYYRITPEQYENLAQAKDKIHYSILLEEDAEIRANWKKQADAAIQLLEEMTGQTFVVDSRRTQWDGATDEQKAEFRTKLAAGYYTTAAADEREKNRIAAKIAKIKEAAQAKADAEIFEAKQKIALIEQVGEDVQDNVIIYQHSKTVSFNWRSWGKQFTPEEINAAWEKIQSIPLFAGYTLKPYKN